MDTSNIRITSINSANVKVITLGRDVCQVTLASLSVREGGLTFVFQRDVDTFAVASARVNSAWISIIATDRIGDTDIVFARSNSASILRNTYQSLLTTSFEVAGASEIPAAFGLLNTSFFRGGHTSIARVLSANVGWSVRDTLTGTISENASINRVARVSSARIIIITDSVNRDTASIHTLSGRAGISGRADEVSECALSGVGIAVRNLATIIIGASGSSHTGGCAIDELTLIINTHLSLTERSIHTPIARSIRVTRVNSTGISIITGDGGIDTVSSAIFTGGGETLVGWDAFFRVQVADSISSSAHRNNALVGGRASVGVGALAISTNVSSACIVVITINLVTGVIFTLHSNTVRGTGDLGAGTLSRRSHAIIHKAHVSRGGTLGHV